jgi:hypothetical protein
MRGEGASVLGEKSLPRFEMRSLKKWAEGVRIHNEKDGSF